MKNFIFYLAGAIFLFVSCQSDLLESDDALIQASKSENATKVTKEFKMLYSRGTVSVIPNTDPFIWGSPDSGCGGKGDLQFVVDGGGIASHIGKFSVMNLACVDGVGNFVSPLFGWITAANGDVIHTMLENVTPDPDHPGFNTYRYKILGGSEGGRFEKATGWLEIYGDSSANPFEFVGVGGEITY